MTSSVEDSAGGDVGLGHELRGVSVHHLRAGVLESVRQLGMNVDEASVHDIEETVIRAKGEYVVCPRDHRRGAAYVDSISGPDNAGMSEFMLSYTWQYKVKDITETLENFCELRGYDVRRTYVWICCLCVNQWRVQEARRQQNIVDFGSFEKTFRGRVEQIGCVLAMLSPWRSPNYIKRVWCDFELFQAVTLKKDIVILTPPSEKDDLRRSVLEGNGVAEVWKVLMGIDIGKAEASVPEDKEHIFRMIEMDCGFERLNAEVSRSLRQWIVDTSEREVITNMRDGTMGGEIAVKMCAEVGQLLTDLHLLDQAAQILEMGSVECEKKGLGNTLCHAKLAKAFGELQTKQKRYLEALQSYSDARRIREFLEQLDTDEGAELLRCTGLARKFSGDKVGAKQSFEEARACRLKSRSMDTVEGADLYRSMGALAEECDLDEAWDLYMEGMQVLCKRQASQTGSGAYLMMCMGNVMLERLDIDNALEIYAEARRMRVRSGTLQTHGGQILEQYAEEARNEQTVQELIDAFRNYESSARDCLVRCRPKFLDIFGDKKDWLLQLGVVREGVLDYKKLLMLLYPESRIVKALFSEVTSEPAVVGPLSHGFPLLGPAGCRDAHSVLVWNIQSPDLCTNSLEFLPGSGFVSGQSLATMMRLLSRARSWMLRPAETRTLGELLCDNAPLERAGEPEMAELTHEETLRGLQEWLESRREVWSKVEIWKALSSQELVEKWATDPAARWEYWKRQTLLDWLRDDCSGGKVNPLLLPEHPTIDQLCWNLGLSSADRCLAGDPGRAARARWLRHSSVHKAAEPLNEGKYDLFKLLVWDMLIEKICADAAEPDALDALVSERRPLDSEVRLRLIADRVRAADIAVLTEVPAEGLGGLEEFWAVSAAPTAEEVQPISTLCTFIFARKDLFTEPVVHTFSSGGRLSTRTVGCTLTRRSDARWLRVIGVHLAGRGGDEEGVMPRIEAMLAPSAVLAGDFNVDLRKRSPPWASRAEHPRLARLLEQASNIPLSLGTCNKQRSPFQAQVSKMFLPDFSMKDFAFLGDCFCPSALGCLLSRSETLPSKTIPSDHAPLTFQLAFGDSLDPCRKAWTGGNAAS